MPPAIAFSLDHHSFFLSPPAESFVRARCSHASRDCYHYFITGTQIFAKPRGIIRSDVQYVASHEELHYFLNTTYNTIYCVLFRIDYNTLSMLYLAHPRDKYIVLDVIKVKLQWEYPPFRLECHVLRNQQCNL